MVNVTHFADAVCTHVHTHTYTYKETPQCKWKSYILFGVEEFISFKSREDFLLLETSSIQWSGNLRTTNACSAKKGFKRVFLSLIVQNFISFAEICRRQYCRLLSNQKKSNRPDKGCVNFKGRCWMWTAPAGLSEGHTIKQRVKVISGLLWKRTSCLTVWAC